MTRKRSRPYNLGLRVIVDDTTRDGWAQRLRAARDERGLTQLALANMVGCTRACISAWERGVNTPSLEDRKALARALRTSVARLFPQPNAA
jgi:transcriptional regulator with XRE-family HTH domain